MALYALVRNGELIEVRDVDPQTVPQHKVDIDGGLLLRPFVENDCDHQPLLEDKVHEIVITPQQVSKNWSAVRRDITAQKLAVKAEARRRILAVYPDWMQANMTARSVELQDIIRINGVWTTEEEAEYELLKTRWAWIKAIRVFSNQIENMDPIPSDFTANSYWTS